MDKRLFILLIAVLSGINLVAQTENDTSRIFNLGEVTVIGDVVENGGNSLLMRGLEIRKINTLSEAIDYIPGLSVSLAGGRNEAMVYVRGFDLRQVPVFVDGVPVSIPYDGYFDLSQIQRNSIGKLTVEKGNASILYGANTMGGAINIISSKPDKKLNLVMSSNLETGLGSLDRSINSIQIGSKHEKWYVIANISYLNQNRLTLPADFDTTSYELDRIRDNSQVENLNYNFKFGFTPKKGQEYSVSFNGVKSAKGIPVYLGNNPQTRVRFWQYPHWDKDGIYFHTKHTLSPSIILKTRWYYDSYYNVLKAYDNNKYDSQTFGYAFTSTYDDYQLGGNVEFGFYRFDNHSIQIGSQVLYSSHKEFNKGEEPREMSDISTGLGIEDIWEISQKLKIEGGVGFFVRKGLKADAFFSDNDSIGSFDTNLDESIHAQVGVKYKLNSTNLFFAKLARKTRFATMKDRYSYRIGRAIPNLDLTSESTLNNEFGYQLQRKKIQIKTSIFYSLISNTIQQVDNVVDDLWQLQNTGKSRFYGFEFNLNYKLAALANLGVAYSYIDQQNISNSNLYFIDVPQHQVIGFVSLEKDEKYFVYFESKYNSSRYSTTDGQYKAKEFFTFNISAEYQLFNSFSLNVGIRNIFDKLYYYSEGYPESGRVFSAGVKYNFTTQK